MMICVDENIPLITVSELRNLGHDVLGIRGTANQGLPDDLLWELTQKESRLLITTDKGFINQRKITTCRQSCESKDTDFSSSAWKEMSHHIFTLNMLKDLPNFG